MDSEPITKLDEAAASFLAFARGVVLKLGEWQEEAGPPLYEDLKVRFVERGRKVDVVKKLDYERFFRRRWDPSSPELKDLARDCVRLHLEQGLLRPPQLADPKGAPILAPSFDEMLPSLVWAVARPVLVAVDKLQTLDVPDEELVAAYRRFVEGWSMPDVPQLATVPLHNFVAEADLRISPCLELVRFTPSDKNVLFSVTAAFSGYQEPDHRASFKLSGQFSNDTTKPVHFGTIAYETRLAIMALRLLKSGDVGARMIYYRSSLEHEEFRGGSGIPFHARDFTQGVYSLKAEEGASLAALIALLRGTQGSLDVGLGRFNQSYSRQSGEDRIIDLTIALESSLLADISEELKYRLALRGATLLKHERKPEEIHALLTALYDARSAIVHEGKPLYELEKPLRPLSTHFADFQPGNLPSLCEEVTRRILRAYLAKLSSGGTLRSINKTLDSELVASIVPQKP